MNEKTEQQTMRQQILAQIDKCAELAYAAGSHFAQHGKHHPWSMRAKAEADAALVNLIEEFAASPSSKSTKEADDEPVAWIISRHGYHDTVTLTKDVADAFKWQGADVIPLGVFASSSIKEDGERAEGANHG